MGHTGNENAHERHLFGFGQLFAGPCVLDCQGADIADRQGQIEITLAKFGEGKPVHHDQAEHVIAARDAQQKALSAGRPCPVRLHLR